MLLYVPHMISHSAFVATPWKRCWLLLVVLRSQGGWKCVTSTLSGTFRCGGEHYQLWGRADIWVEHVNTEIWQKIPIGHEHLGSKGFGGLMCWHIVPGQEEQQVILFGLVGESWESNRDVKLSHSQFIWFVSGLTCASVDHATLPWLLQIFFSQVIHPYTT